MKFNKFSKYLQKLENTTKRLEITAILTDLIDNLSVKEIDTGMYLTLGSLDAPFRKVKFNIADKMMIKILSSAYGKEEDEIKNLYGDIGDLGDVAFRLDKNESKAGMEITKVHQKLLEIAKTEGTGSQDKKIELSSKLLVDLDNLSSKYIVRIILGTTRLGFTELTIIDALSKLIKGDKSARKRIEERYNMHPDIGLVAKKIKEKGLKNIEKISMETGVPILSQKPQRLSDFAEIIERMEGIAWAEYKLDGTRVQLHLDRDKKIQENEQKDLFEEGQGKIFVKTYTRNLEETTHQFPEIVEAADKQIKAESIILDGEAIGYDKKTGKFLTFQEIIKRKRKYDIKDVAKEIPLKYFVFDILYLDGKPLMSLPLVERRNILNRVIRKNEVIEVDFHKEIGDANKLRELFEESKDKGLEGLVVKNPKSPYQAGARSFAWVKLKKGSQDIVDDDFDCVILGYYFGKGARSNFGIGGFLAGVYDEESDSFKSLTKVGTGLKDTDWEILKKKSDKIRLVTKPANVEVKKELYPDVWIKPEILVVLKADEITVSPNHTAGYALRFPRYMAYRTDKKPQEATNTKEIKDLYKEQKRGYY